MEEVICKAKKGDLIWLKSQSIDKLREQDAYGSDALTWAAGCGQLEVVRYLVQICDPEREVWPIKKGSAPTTAGRRALHFAARNNRLEVVRFLVNDLKCNPNPLSENGVSPLQLAVWQLNVDVVKFFLTQVKNARQRNVCGCSLAHWLAMSPPGVDFLPVANLLLHYLSYTAFREDRNHSDHTPLHKAAFVGNWKLCQWLIDVVGADDDCVDRTNRKPSDEAERNNHHELANWLRKTSRHRRLSRARKKRHIIKKAFCARAKQLHPDRCGEAHAFIKLLEARDLLLLECDDRCYSSDRSDNYNFLPDMSRLSLNIRTVAAAYSISEPLAILRERIVATVLVHGNYLHLALLRPKYSKLWGSWDLDADRRASLGISARGKSLYAYPLHPAFLPVLRIEYEGGLKMNRPYLSALVGSENIIQRRLSLLENEQ